MELLDFFVPVLDFMPLLPDYFVPLLLLDFFAQVEDQVGTAHIEQRRNAESIEVES